MNGLAIYAAIVGTASLSWNIWCELRKERSDVRVEVVTEPVPVGLGRYELTVIVRNYGKTDEAVERIGLNFHDPTDEDFGDAGESQTVDEPLAPRRNVRWTWDLGKRRWRVGREYQGFAVLASGRNLTSEWREFDAELLERGCPDRRGTLVAVSTD